VQLTDEQRQHVESCTALAKRLAGGCQSLGKFLTRDEIRSEAARFLIEAAFKYDPAFVSTRTGRPVKFSSYAYQFIRRNLARLSKTMADDWVKRGVRTIQESDDAESQYEREDDADDELEAHDAARVVERGMETLTADQRRVVAMRFGIGHDAHTVDETAAAMGLNRRQVQELELTAMAAMRSFLDDSPE